MTAHTEPIPPLPESSWNGDNQCDWLGNPFEFTREQMTERDAMWQQRLAAVETQRDEARFRAARLSSQLENMQSEAWREIANDRAAAIVRLREALQGWLDQPETTAAYDAAMERAVQALADTKEM